MEGNDKLKSSIEKFLCKNKKSQIWTKKALFEYFRLKFEKANVIFEINAFEFIQIPKVEQNNNHNSNNKKFDQKCLSWVFWSVLLYLKSTPSNLSKCKVWCKNKKSKIKQKSYTNVDLKIGQYLSLHMEIICRRSHIKTLCNFWDIALILNVS